MALQIWGHVDTAEAELDIPVPLSYIDIEDKRTTDERATGTA